MATKDENNESLLLGVDQSGNVVPAQFDATTGALLITYAASSTGGTKPADLGDAEHDDNGVETALGVLTTSGTPYPFLMDDNGYLLVDHLNT